MPKSPFNSHKPGKEPTKKCPPFEEAADFYIENDSDKKRAIDFGAWLRKNKLSPSAGNNGYNWYVKFYYIDYNKQNHRSTYHGCYIKMFNDTWHILPSKDILTGNLDKYVDEQPEELVELFMKSLKNKCYNCRADRTECTKEA